MTFQWTSEAVVAALGIVLAGGGAIITNAVQWGATTTRIETVEQHQHEQDAVISTNRQALDSTIVQGAQVSQKLDDMKDQLNRIEKHLR
jgi:hypothetical protein